MVCLNETISFEKIILRDQLINKLNESLRLNFELDLNKNIIDKIINNNKNKIKELFENDYFIYKTMNRNICSHKYKKGKNEGYFCCKTITKKGNKEKYVCRMHNPDYKPEKRKNKGLKNSKNCKIFENNKKNEVRQNRTFKNNKNKIIKRKKHIKKKIIIHGIINFKDIINKLLT